MTWAARAAAVAAALSLGGLSPAPAAAQGFGQNHVVLRDFQWKIRSTEHFDIHYYEDSEPMVPAAAEILEKSYRRISQGLRHDFYERRPFFLYASVNEMQQSNIVQVGDGTGGVTEAFKDRFMVYGDGSGRWLDGVTTHELVHVFQYSVLVSGFWRSARILKSIVYPLWMMEGMAEHFTEGLDDATEEYYLRDAATSGGLIPLWKLEHFSHLKPHQVTLAYKSGATVMEFISKEYGKEKIGEMLRLYETRFETSSMLQDLLGLDVFAFDRRWREYLEERYRRQARLERLREPADFGVQLTTGSPMLPEFNASPVFTPDGRTLAYISTREGHPPALVLQELTTGKRRPVVSRDFNRIENVELGRFTSLARVLAASPDGKTLVFSAQKNHRESLFFYDLPSGKLRRRALPGFATVSQPAFSPDGKRLAFIGMKGSLTDVYVLDLDGGGVTQVTADPQDDQSPAFAPDGKSIVYSTEVRFDGDPMPYQRRLYRVDLEGLQTRRLLDLRGAARDPYFAADGRRLLFSLETERSIDVYELDLEEGRTRRLTRSLGASVTPLYAPSGDVVFASFRRNSVHVFRGRRESLLAEEVPEARYLPKPPRPAQVEARLQPPPPVQLAQLPGMDLSTTTVIPRPEVSTAPATLSAARPYRFKASTDLFLPALFYSSQGGLFALTYWQASDMLGNHGLATQLAINTGQGFYNYQTQYNYSRYRPQLSAGVAGLVQRDSIDDATGLSGDQSIHAQYAGLAYPLDRYHRVELSAAAVQDRQNFPDVAGSRVNRDGRLSSAYLVRDTVGGRYLVANHGSRLRAGYSGAHEILGGNVRYYTFSGHAHKFFPLGDLSSLALRGFAADSNGPDRQEFHLGGLGGLRGYGSSTVRNVGNRAALGTAEVRFPVFPRLDYYMWYLFPDFYFKAITGALFTDAGYSWDSRGELSHAQWRDVRHSYGVGLRVHTFILQLVPLVLAFDYARPTTNSNDGIFYVYLGPLF